MVSTKILAKRNINGLIKKILLKNAYRDENGGII